MAKKGMKRYYNETNKNAIKPVEELQGKVKSGKEKAKLNSSDFIKFSDIHSSKRIPFGLAESDTAIENIANDLGLTAADMQDFKG
ncbi:MAG: hypothetical protein E7566_02585 [Ruminococcaceae bacterium]|nr:hypothetical protein [Oscillospiraceae bacterium]